MIINVAIVEDKKETLDGLKSIVDSSNDLFCCGTFESAESFKNSFKHLQVDVVLMDIHMPPGMTGIECVAHLHKLRPNVLFMMCTNLEDSDSVYSALKVGAVGYIVKNTTPEKMIDAIKDIHVGGSPMSPQIARKVTVAFKQDDSNAEQVNSLTQLERDTVNLLLKGFQYKEIADKHEVSIETIRKRIRNIYVKLQVNNVGGLANKFNTRTNN